MSEAAMRRIGLVAALAHVGTIFAANWLIEHVGIVDVVPGPVTLDAPAGVLAAGAAFILRDVVHETLGVRAAIAAIFAGAALSLLVSPAFALASASAFLFSELADLAVYTPLRRRSKVAAMVLSNTVGLLIDSAWFLLAAFGSLAFFWGQAVGKAEMTALALLVVMLRAVLARKPHVELA